MNTFVTLVIAWASYLPPFDHELAQPDPAAELGQAIGQAIGGPFCLMLLGAIGVWFFWNRSKKT